MRRTKFDPRRAYGVLLPVALAGMVAASCSKEEKPATSSPAMKAPADAALATVVAGKHACKTLNACKSQGGCSTGDNGCSGKNSCQGKGGCATVDHHTCAGLNTCKGLGGCATGDNGCVAKNSCKSKGGCGVPVKH